MAAETEVERYNRKLGLWLFLLYLVMYGGFVALVTVNYKATGAAAFGGLNVAVVYGLGLIVGAFVLALVYMGMARNDT